MMSFGDVQEVDEPLLPSATAVCYAKPEEDRWAGKKHAFSKISKTASLSHLIPVSNSSLI